MATRKRKTFFDLFDEIRSEMDRMWEETMGSMLLDTPMCDVSKRVLEPLTHIYETEEEVIVTADLPFAKKEDIKVQITENLINLEAPLKPCFKMTPTGPIRRETEFNVFKKTIKLPAYVDAKKAKGKFRNGMLQITAPKKIEGYEIPIE